ncbi:Hpt domain-containing protein [Methylobacterium trifolii]|uniref:HPt domain-containing protein n=1 Tax=Methylobacterium trifolii TaxID=1003092 RepID=A0ABQ4TYE6_9HYPH|nr:Hpt domain-containing protein [Methylobacterium trifolii]GJE59571.1 hypothetical protein MPOCJGCO_1667 [Methylobacterium trifolii]
MTIPLLDRATFDDLGAVIGTEKILRLADRFAASLSTAFPQDGCSGDDYAREAHTLISMSGMLGCERLSQACRMLETAAKVGADLAGPLAEIRDLRDRTIEAIAAFKAEIGGRAA